MKRQKYKLSVNIAQNLFKGKIYLTIDHNLWVLNGNNTQQELLKDGDIHDPAVSPDGKWIAFVVRYKNYSNIAYMPASGGKGIRLLDGNGQFVNDSGFEHNTFHWFVQPSWSPDSSHILFLSDLQKNFYWANLGSPFSDAYFLDLQVFSIPINNPANPQLVALASWGDGGDRDAMYRPGHPDQIAFTHYSYDAATKTQQVIQIFMENPNEIANHPGKYYPGYPGAGYDPAVAVTPEKDQNLQPAFSPDGNAIAYIRRESATSMGLYVMGVPEGVTTNPNDPTTAKQALVPYQHSSHLLSGQYISQPVWSPDGKQIAYIAYNNGEFDLWLVNVTHNAQTGAYSVQGNPQQLTTGGIDGDSRPAWTA